jgi:hypothetical protein
MFKLFTFIYYIVNIFTTTTSVQSYPELDFRVSKAIGSKGYDKIRISVISDNLNTSEYSNLFTYNQQFKYRWTDKYLSTGITSIIPGNDNIIKIGEQEIKINIPIQGEGVRGLIIGDPCYSSEFIICVYKDKFNILNHLSSLINAINSHSDVSYWQLLGDNFYDKYGELTSNFFKKLSYATKSKIFLQIPGNHDFWVKGGPDVWTKSDQLGNGNFQYYAQDVIASTDKSPYDFAVNPDINPSSENIPVSSNFFTYNMIGNVLMIAFSGAHTYESMLPYFIESCNYATEVNPSLIFILGHWNDVGMGAPSSVPNIYNNLTVLPECIPHKTKLRYFEGHQHCNQIVEPDIGFMVGANGMSDSRCGGEFGLPIVDTTNSRFRIYYFPINKFSLLHPIQNYDNYDNILDCIQNNGVSKCYHLANLWVDTPIP